MDEMGERRELSDERGRKERERKRQSGTGQDKTRGGPNHDSEVGCGSAAEAGGGRMSTTGAG